MSNVLVVYASHKGQTEKVARRIAGTLRARGHVTELVDAERLPAAFDPSRYQLLVVGAPILMGRYPRAIVRFVRRHRTLLQRVPSAFFSVGLNLTSHTSDGRAETLEVVEAFVARTGWRPRRVELFAGALPYSRYNVLVRYIMRRISAKEGGDTDTSRDYEYTDWAAVDGFATELASAAAAPPQAVGAAPLPVLA